MIKKFLLAALIPSCVLGMGNKYDRFAKAPSYSFGRADRFAKTPSTSKNLGPPAYYLRSSFPEGPQYTFGPNNNASKNNKTKDSKNHRKLIKKEEKSYIFILDGGDESSYRDQSKPYPTKISDSPLRYIPLKTPSPDRRNHNQITATKIPEISRTKNEPLNHHQSSKEMINALYNKNPDMIRSSKDSF